MSDPKVIEVERESATECLIRAMEGFSEDDDEVIDIIVCYRTKSGQLWKVDNGLESHEAVGILEIIKAGFVNEAIDANDDEQE